MEIEVKINNVWIFQVSMYLFCSLAVISTKVFVLMTRRRKQFSTRVRGASCGLTAWLRFKAAVFSVVRYKYCLWLAACQGRSRLPGPNFHFSDTEKKATLLPYRHSCVHPALWCLCLTAMTAKCEGSRVQFPHCWETSPSKWNFMEF